MILTFSEKPFSLNGKTELFNENNELVFTCIYDFSYKKRIRILDKANNELAYIQFRALSSVDEIGLFDRQGNKLAYFKLHDLVLLDDAYRFVGNLDNYKVVDTNGIEIMNVTSNMATINNADDVLKCIMCLYVYANPNEVE